MRLWVAILTSLICTACTTIKKPYLFEAEKDKKKIVFFGTIHTGVPIWDLPSIVTRKLDQSQLAFFEIDSRDIANPARSEPGVEELKNEAMRQIIRPGEPLLNERLTAREFEALKAALPSYPAKTLGYMRPGLVIGLLSEGNYIHMTKYEASLLEEKNSMDFALSRRAQDRKIPVMSLDRNVLEKCRAGIDRHQLQRLKEILAGRSFTDLAKDFEAMVKAYRESNDDYLRGQTNEIGQRDTCILEDRNRDWVNALDQIVMPNEQAFVAVGVAHLLESKEPSVLKLLQERGYTVRRHGDKN